MKLTEEQIKEDWVELKNGSKIKEGDYFLSTDGSCWVEADTTIGTRVYGDRVIRKKNDFDNRRKWRLLEKGEVIEKGDYCKYRDEKEWKPVNGLIGRDPEEWPFYSVIRKVETAPIKENFDKREKLAEMREDMLNKYEDFLNAKEQYLKEKS